MSEAFSRARIMMAAIASAMALARVVRSRKRYERSARTSRAARDAGRHPSLRKAGRYEPHQGPKEMARRAAKSVKGAQWVADYEAEEKRLGIYKDDMSRSNPTDAVRNPSTRWFSFASGIEGGFVRYYDKEAGKNIDLGDATVGSKFVFILLDELATVQGWHDPSESAIFANEVRDTRQDTLVVKSFKGGELASGLYAQIKDRIVAVGGHFVASCYIAYKDGDGLKLGNIKFKGSAFPHGWTSRNSARRRRTRAVRASKPSTSMR
jgi:hypothetical protein